MARLIGVLGTMVWDRIDHPDGPRVERWGGIAYSLAAAAAALPEGWRIRPIVKVGRDLEAEARAFMAALPGVELPGGVVRTESPNNRVHLVYRDREHRDEHLTGGVPPWRWEELGPHLEGLDGLFINLISGFELELDVAERLGTARPGLLYADLHSLLLGAGDEGARVPRPLERRGRWLGAFDVVQMNEPELRLVAGGAGDAWAVIEAAVAEAGSEGRPRAVVVTRGSEGATIVAGAPPRRRTVPVEGAARPGDPTGCGDVWGATCFVALARGESLEAAARAGNRAASRKLGHRGADGLYDYLRAQT